MAASGSSSASSPCLRPALSVRCSNATRNCRARPRRPTEGAMSPRPTGASRRAAESCGPTSCAPAAPELPPYSGVTAADQIPPSSDEENTRPPATAARTVPSPEPKASGGAPMSPARLNVLPPSDDVITFPPASTSSKDLASGQVSRPARQDSNLRASRDLLVFEQRHEGVARPCRPPVQVVREAGSREVHHLPESGACFQAHR